MREGKYLWSIIIPITVCVVLIIGIFGSVSLYLYDEKKDIQVPQVTYGEFPFKLTYRIKDEIVTVEDTYICEFKGVKWGFDTGAYRKWENYIESTKKNYIHVMQDEESAITISVGGIDSYMNLEDFGVEAGFLRRTRLESGGVMISYIPDKEALSEYDIEIISFEHADTIQALAEEDDVYDIVDSK